MEDNEVELGVEGGGERLSRLSWVRLTPLLGRLVVSKTELAKISSIGNEQLGFANNAF